MKFPNPESRLLQVNVGGHLRNCFAYSALSADESQRLAGYLPEDIDG